MKYPGDQSRTCSSRLGVLFLVSALTLIEPGVSAQDWARSFRVGALVGLNIKADFALSGQFGVSENNAGPPGVPGVDHVYDDGYVRVDDTGNAGGYTSYWGYQNASQWDGVGNPLIFHSTTSFATSGTAEPDGEAHLGVDFVYGGRVYDWGPTIVGWELGFSLLPVRIVDNQTLSGDFSRLAHSFDTGGIVLPDAPYNGGAGGIGPTIGDIASEVMSGSDMITGTITGSRALDVKLYSFRLGPTFQWEFWKRCRFVASGGGALALVAGDYQFNETLNPDGGGSTVNRGSFDDSELVFGGYASATFMVRTHEPADIFVSVHYMTLGDFNISGGGRSARLQLGDGVYLSAGINWPF